MEEKTQVQRNKIVIPGYLRISKVIAYLLYAWVLIGIISLTLRIFLLLFSANRSTPFVELIADISGDYLSPFRGIFPAKSVGETGYLDVSALFAIIVYLFVMWGFLALINYVQNRIDISRIKQKKELEEIKRQQQKLASPKPSTVVSSRSVKVTTRNQSKRRV